MQRFLIILFFAGVLLSCGGGGDGGGAPSVPMTQIGGVVVAPSGTLAKATSQGLFRWFASLIGFPDEAAAQAKTLSPVQNARVFLLNVDNVGNPIGSPLAVSTTDANGAFVFSVPKDTNLSPTASTLTVIQAAMGNAPGPVAIGTAGVLNVPAVQSVMLVDPAGELGTRRIIAAGISNFSTASGAAAVAGYVGLIQALLDEVPGLAGSSIATTITNIQGHFSFQNEVLPALVDIEQSGLVDQSIVAGTYKLFIYHAYADSPTTSFRRTTENGDLTFDPVKGTVVVNSNEFGGTLNETCTTICTRTFTLQFFRDQTLGGELLFFRTAKNRVILSAPGSSSSAHANPTGTVAIFGFKLSDGERSLGIAVKRGAGISGADFAATFNYVDFGSILNQSVVNRPIVSGNTWTGIVQSRSGAGRINLGGSNSPVSLLGGTNTDSTINQQVSCNPSGVGCIINATLSPSLSSGFLPPTVLVPFTVLPDGTLIGNGSGAMSSDRVLYAATLTDPLNPQDTSFSVVVRQPSGMAPANITGTYRVITLQDDLMTTAQVTTRLVHGTAQFDGVSSSTFDTLTAQVDRTEGCPAGTCGISTVITGATPSLNETRTYNVTPTGILTFSGGNIPSGATVSGGVSPDASFFVVGTQIDNVAGTSTRAITLGVKMP